MTNLILEEQLLINNILTFIQKLKKGTIQLLNSLKVDSHRYHSTKLAEDFIALNSRIDTCEDIEYYILELLKEKNHENS